MGGARALHRAWYGTSARAAVAATTTALGPPGGLRACFFAPPGPHTPHPTAVYREAKVTAIDSAQQTANITYSNGEPPPPPPPPTLPRSPGEDATTTSQETSLSPPPLATLSSRRPGRAAAAAAHRPSRRRLTTPPPPSLPSSSTGGVGVVAMESLHFKNPRVVSDLCNLHHIHEAGILANLGE